LFVDATACLQMIVKRNPRFTKRGDFVKKILICFVLLLTCALLLMGCGEASLAKTPTFSEALAKNGFTPEGGFIDKLDVWTYEDRPLREHGDLMAGCGVMGGVETFSVKDVCYGSDEFQTSDDRSYADRSLDFSMYVPIEGVVMPYGMTFNNTLEELLQTLGYDIDIGVDDERLLEHVLIPDYESKLILRCKTDAESGKRDYTLTFFEYSEAVWSSSNTVIEMTGSVTLGFEAGTNRLDYLSFALVEKRIYNKKELSETPTFSEALDQNGFKFDMTEADFTTLLEKATYRGIPLDSYEVENLCGVISTMTQLSVTDVCQGEYYESFGALEEKTETKRASLSFSAPIGEIILPYGMTFGHTLGDLLAAMGFADFSVNENDAWATTLMQDNGGITLYDYSHAPETEADCPEGVRFAVSYSVGVSQSSDSENPVNIEFARKMTLYFAEETGYLSSVAMSISEKTE